MRAYRSWTAFKIQRSLQNSFGEAGRRWPVREQADDQDPNYHETRNLVGSKGGTTPKAKYYLMTDSA